MYAASEATIQRCEHDVENPFTMVSNALIRDADLTPSCRWLLIYLLSSITKWTIKVSTVANHLKEHMCKESVYKLFDESIKAGYMKREEYSEKGLKRYRYILSENKKFKKCLPCTDLPDTVPQSAAEPDSLKNTKEKKEQLKKSSSSSPPPPKKQNLKEEMRKIFSYATEETFEEAWKRYLLREKKNPGDLKAIEPWLRRVIDGLLQRKDLMENGVEATLEEMHHDIAMSKENKPFPHDRVVACKNVVELWKGAHCREVRYDCNDAEWKSQTGWK